MNEESYTEQGLSPIFKHSIFIYTYVCVHTHTHTYTHIHASKSDKIFKCVSHKSQFYTVLASYKTIFR